MEKINTDCFQDFVRDQYLLSISILNQHTILKKNPLLVQAEIIAIQ